MGIKVEGLDNLQARIKDVQKGEMVKGIVRKNGADLKEAIEAKAEFRGHYEGNQFVKPTGATKGSVQLKFSDGGFTAEAEPTTEYSPYLEYGTRFMDAQPFVRPAFDEVSRKFISDMEKYAK